MRVLVTGAAGFLGKPLVEELLSHGHEVRAMVRPATDQSALQWRDQAEVWACDLRSGQLDGALDGVDVVVHLAAATKGSDDDKLLETMLSTERLLDAIKQRDGARIVLVSSLVLYDWTGPIKVLSERSPLEPSVWRRDGYTRAKYYQERWVRRLSGEEGWPLTILRPGLVWGPGATYPVGPARRIGATYLVIGSRTVLPLTHIANCARYMAASIEAESALGATINLIDDYELTSAQLVREHLSRTGTPGRCVTVPYTPAWLLVKAIDRTGRAVLGADARLPSTLIPEIFAARYRPVHYDHSERVRTLGHVPVLSLDECLELTFGRKRGRA